MDSLDQIKMKFIELKNQVVESCKKGFSKLNDFKKDSMNKIDGYLKEKDFKLVRKYKELSYENKMKVVLVASALVLGVGSLAYNTRAYEVYVNDDIVGILRTEKDIESAFKEIREELCEEYKLEVVLNEDLSTERVHVFNNSLTDVEELKSTVKEKVSFLVEGYELRIDNKVVGILKEKEDIDGVIDRLEKEYIAELDENARVEEIKILEDIKIVKREVPMFALEEDENIYEKIINGGEDVTIHVVEAGDSLWTIAEKYDTTMEDLIAANEGRDPDKLQIDDEVRLVMTKPLLTVAITSEIEYDKELEYDEEIEYDENMYANKKEVKEEGKEGKAKVLAQSITHNGELIEEKIIKEDILEEPVKKLIVQGTKPVPSTIGTGVFSMPTRGRISSPYGRRNGRMHKGLDIAARSGTPIEAADGGTVVSAGYQGAYGYLVEIDHKNGYRTKYAHCSRILVNVGDKVHKGQHIANVGNTGRSTGPHLHLEVLKNGVNQNPSNYVN